MKFHTLFYFFLMIRLKSDSTDYGLDHDLMLAGMTKSEVFRLFTGAS